MFCVVNAQAIPANSLERQRIHFYFIGQIADKTGNMIPNGLLYQLKPLLKSVFHHNFHISTWNIFYWI